MQVVYTGDSPSVVSASGLEFVNGQPVEVPQDEGDSLTLRADFEVFTSPVTEGTSK